MADPRTRLDVLTLPAALGLAATLAAAWFWPRLGWLLLAGLAAVALWQWRAWARFDRWRGVPHARPPELPPPWSELSVRMYRNALRARARQRSLVRQLRRDRQFAANLPDALVVLDRHDVIEWFSPLAETYFGLTRGDLGKLLPALVRHRDLIALLEGRGGERIAELQVAPYERTLELRITAIDADRRLLIARDTTQIQRLLTMRQDFVANVSHELRTPLTVIAGYVEQMDSPDMDQATLRTLAGRLTSPAVRMKNLVDDLLLLTRLESSTLPAPAELDVVNVHDMLHAMAAEVRHMDHDRHEIVLEADASVRACCVERELYSAISNLLVNATRYSPAGTRVQVRWSAQGDGARCSVDDQGVGIAPEHVSRITERFYRVDLGRSRQMGGTGLGLAIVKHVLRRHGSELQIRSTPNVGSSFFFDLDAAHTRVGDTREGGSRAPVADTASQPS